MIKECLDVFEKILDPGDKLILDNYVPKDGTYILVEKTEKSWNVRNQVDICFDKKKGELIGRSDEDFGLICYLDYYSKLIEMNKPIDPNKVIHSNNYLSLAVKKESITGHKLTQKVLEDYYDILRDPSQKYKNKPKLLASYEETEKSLGPVDLILLEQIVSWLKEDHSADIEKIDLSKKDYLKVYFVLPDLEQTKRLYEKEGRRYLLPNIYNSSDYNMVIEDQLYGLPNDNMGMNAKKPYLENKSRKVAVPYLLNRQEVLIQAKFYDYLMGQASQGKVNIYIDPDQNTIRGYQSNERPDGGMSGYFLRIRKGKEVEIHNADQVVCFNPNLAPTFYYKELLKTRDREDYGPFAKIYELEHLVDEVLFGRYLINNYFTPIGDLVIQDGCVKRSLIKGRDRLFTWFYKDHTVEVKQLLMDLSGDMIRNSLLNGYFNKAKEQLNLKWSLMDYFTQSKEMENTMNQVREAVRGYILSKEEWDFSNDQEYFFAVGQMVSFFITKSKSKRLPLSFINPFMDAKNDKIIKAHLRSLFRKYNYDISIKDIRVKDLFSHVMLYSPQKSVDADMLAAGVAADNLIFEKTKEEG